MSNPPATKSKPFHVVLTGNPNCGKTTLFNALTGLRAKVGNYAGVTVERKEGRLQDLPQGAPPIVILDLPGTYSLSPQSLDEQIARDVLFGRLSEVPQPDAVVVVVDASNLERNLYYATQVAELGYPTLIALNMMDVAEANGHQLDPAYLSELLDLPVLPMIASTRTGLDDLRKLILGWAGRVPERKAPKGLPTLPALYQAEIRALAAVIAGGDDRKLTMALADAALLLGDEKNGPGGLSERSPQIQSTVKDARKRLEEAGVDWRSAAIESRYDLVGGITASVVIETAALQETFSDRLDRILTHKAWGILIFVGIMLLMFQSIFTFAKLPMEGLQAAMSWLGDHVGALIPPGDLHSLVVDGAIAGVSAVVVFLPQICLLFLFIGLLEDTGYMARAAFLMDRLMSKVGLHGKSFIPMLSSFACAIPGIMATRTIESPKDRLVTILVAPLMSCSARLPVYTLLIAACIPDRKIFGVLTLPGLTMLGMYLLGIVLALVMAWLFKRTLLKGATPMLIMELPPYKKPVATVVMRHMWDRSRLFLHRAGTVILGINILLWFLATYPRDGAREREFTDQRQALASQASSMPAQELTEKTAVIENAAAGERLRHSFAGRLGHWIEPVIKPLGFDWKIGIGIVASFAAREIFVSTMSVVYNVGAAEDSAAATPSLAKIMRQQRFQDGRPVYTTLTGVTLMVFYALALQCVSTVAVVRRETNSWKWPLFQWLYMGAMAWMFAFITYQGGRLLGY